MPPSTIRPWRRGISVLLVGVVIVSSLTFVTTSRAPSDPRPTASLAASTPPPGGSVVTAVPSSAIQPSSASIGPVALPPKSPHPGTLNIYEVAPSGAVTEDPAAAYDTVSYEPILNVYESLVAYNGGSTDTYVPVLATCVPGTVQCSTDYGSNLTYAFGPTGVPTAWTFVLDPAARFYAPGTGTGWPVYPSDVVFSVARALAFSDLPFVARSAGWLLAQALLPPGNASWDGGIHFPYNNTPQRVLSSMLVNDSAYCPSAALSAPTGNGCVTFLTSASGQAWPAFLQLVASDLASAVVPCGWFTSQTAGVPGWAGSLAPQGAGSCLLPDGGTTTNSSSWSTYLAHLGLTDWDAFEKLAMNWPAPQPAVQWSMSGSGPYSIVLSPGTGYQLTASPSYAQPSGCSGAGGLAVYPGQCDPAPGKYAGAVNVYWEPDDSYGISQYSAGTADLAEIEAVHTLTERSLEAAGKIAVYQFPTLTSFFSGVDLHFNESAYAVDYPSSPPQTIPEGAFSDVALRNFYVDSYPYSQIESELNTVNGFPFDFDSGGPIPYGMGSSYPANVSYPYLQNSGVPDANSSDVGGAAWWWAQLGDRAGPYFDAQIANCTSTTPCTWAIENLLGDPEGNQAATDWVDSIMNLTGGALRPFVLASSFDPFCPAACSTVNPIVSYLGDGWSPDIPDPSNVVQPLVGANGLYPVRDQVAAQLSLTEYDNATLCGHGAATYADLVYWAHAAENVSTGSLNDSCEGVAYRVLNGFVGPAAAMPNGPLRALEYNLMTQISNGLALSLWQGQANAIVSAAPWIDGRTLDTNPMTGGGGDELWFDVSSLPPVTQVRFRAVGLPAHSEWGVLLGNPATRLSNETVGRLGEIAAWAPNGSLTFQIESPVGYGVVRVIGTGHPSFGGVEVSTGVRQYTLTARFGPLEPVRFNETPSTRWPGLPNGTAWSVTLAPIGTGVAPGTTSATTGSSVHFLLPAGATYSFEVGKPSVYKSLGGHGSFVVPPRALLKSVRFALCTGLVTFVRSGLPGRTPWTVVVNGAINETLTGTGASLAFRAINGTYSFTVPSVGAWSPSPSNGSFTVRAPHADRTVVVFVDPVGPLAPGHPAGGSSDRAPPLAPELRRD